MCVCIKEKEKKMKIKQYQSALPFIFIFKMNVINYQKRMLSILVEYDCYA